MDGFDWGQIDDYQFPYVEWSELEASSEDCKELYYGND